MIRKHLEASKVVEQAIHEECTCQPAKLNCFKVESFLNTCQVLSKRKIAENFSSARTRPVLKLRALSSRLDKKPQSTQRICYNLFRGPQTKTFRQNLKHLKKLTRWSCLAGNVDISISNNFHGSLLFMSKEPRMEYRRLLCSIEISGIPSLK